MSLTLFLNDLVQIIISFTDMFTNIMQIFMKPPLSVFVGLSILAAMFTAWGIYFRGTKTAGFFGFK